MLKSKGVTYEHGDMLFCPIQKIVVELANHPQGQVLESQGRAVEHLGYVQTGLQPGYLDWCFRVLEGLEGLFYKPVKVLSGDVLLPNEDLHDPLDNLGVGQPAPLLQLVRGKLWDALWEVEAPIFCITRKQHLKKESSRYHVMMITSRKFWL